MRAVSVIAACVVGGIPCTHELRDRVGPLHARTSTLGRVTLPSSLEVVELRLPPDRER